MTRLTTCLCAAALATACAVPASAANRIPLSKAAPDDFALLLSGEYRINANFLTDFAVDAEGNRMGQSAWVDQRLRARFDLQVKQLTLSTEWDLFSGVMAGDLWDIPGDADERNRHKVTVLSPEGFAPRRAALGYRFDFAEIEVGLVTSHWGLGLLANDGAHEDWFGREDLGDRVLRFRFTAKPLYAMENPGPKKDGLLVSGGFDWVIADDIAVFAEEQLALQTIASIVYLTPKSRAGFYGVYRHQEEMAFDRTTDVGAFDLYGDVSAPLTAAPDWTLRAAAEAALVVGSTDRALSYNERERTAVLNGGITGFLELAAPKRLVAVRLRGGVASGDGDPDDGVSGDFTADRNFSVGSVLFEHHQGGVEAATHALLIDPEHSGKPPEGVDAITTEGAFRRAAFFQPMVSFLPAPWLEARLGVLLAGATAPVRQPFYSVRAGGTPRNHHDEEPTGGDFLGAELNWAVRLGGELPIPGEAAPKLSGELLVQGGHLKLGPALVKQTLAEGEETEDSIHHVQITGRFRW